MLYYVPEGILLCWPILWTTEMGHKDYGTAIPEYLLNSGYGSPDTGVIGNIVLIVEGHIEIYAYQSPLVAEVILGELRHKLWFGVRNKGFPKRKPLLKL